MNDLTVLYEDNQIVVVLKPQNMPTQADSSGDPDLLSAVKEYVRVKYEKPGEAFIGLVHRLDRPTGGVMVFARTSKAAARLCAQIQDGGFTKKYIAVAAGRPKAMQGKLTDYLRKDEATNSVEVVPASVEGAKKAELVYRVLENNAAMSLIDVTLLTGRPHQIRAQLSHIGSPLFGDVKYGDKLAKGQNLALWAYELRFEHPTNKNAMRFTAFPPLDKTPWRFFEIERHINVVRPSGY